MSAIILFMMESPWVRLMPRLDACRAQNSVRQHTLPCHPSHTAIILCRRSSLFSTKLAPVQIARQDHQMHARRLPGPATLAWRANWPRHPPAHARALSSSTPARLRSQPDGGYASTPALPDPHTLLHAVFHVTQ